MHEYRGRDMRLETVRSRHWLFITGAGKNRIDLQNNPAAFEDTALTEE